MEQSLVPGPAKHSIGDDRRRRPAQGLLVTFGLSVVLAAAIVFPIWRPLVVAAVIAAPLAGWHDRLTAALGGRRSISAAMFTTAVVVVVLIPIALAAVIVVSQALQLADLIKRTVQQAGLAGLLQPLPDQVERWLRGRYGDLLEDPRAALSGMHLWSRASGVVGAMLAALASATHLLVELGLMLVALFFFLRDGSRLVAWIRDNVPVPPPELDSLLDDLRGVSKSVVAGHVATGAVQAGIATLGYAIAGVPSAMLFGLVTFLASFIPSVGTAVAGLPAIGLLVILHRGGWAIFLAAWMVLLVGTLDNLLRPLFMRGGASHLHGALIFFSLIGGMLMFGATGLVVGPLGLVFFLAMAKAVTRAARASRPKPADSITSEVGRDVS